MKNSNNNFLASLGYEGLIFGLSGLLAIFFGISSFWGFSVIKGDQLSSILIGSIGFLLLAVITLNTNRKSEINEIKDTIGMSDSRTLHSTRELEEGLGADANKAKRFILDTSLNRKVPDPTPMSFLSGYESNYRRTIYERVQKHEISFKRVEIVYHRQALEWLIFRLLLHEGLNYLIRHYEPPETPIPMMGFVSFDNEIFYLGGFHLDGSPTEETALAIREPNLAQTFANYWDTFWSAAIPLNEGGAINWAELKQIGTRIGVSELEFDEMIKKLKIDVATERRKFGR